MATETQTPALVAAEAPAREPKPGYKATEFWSAALGQPLGALLLLIGALGTIWGMSSDASDRLMNYGGLVLVGGNLGYLTSRTLVKLRK